jgi:two-component system, OmpR family, KDP operon response regulator KdpE
MVETGLKILVVDDEPAIRRFLRTALGTYGYSISEAAYGEEALNAVATGHPDVVILDLGLPDMDGVEVTHRLREWTQIPIVIISVRDQENEKVNALDAGADDYLTKPFGIEELMARIRVALRRSALPEKEPVFRLRDLVIDMARRLVTVSGQLVALTPTEYDILRILVTNSGKVLTHRQLALSIWGNTDDDQAHLLRVHVGNLRRKIETDPSRPYYIATDPGVGYRFRVESY